VKYALIGYGRMGRAIEQQAAGRGHIRTASVDPAAGDPPLDPRRLGGARVAFEFTTPDSAEGNALALLEGGISVVCGTTGWTPSDGLRETARTADAGFLLAPNFSVGVNLFFRVVDHAARAYAALGLHDPFIQEVHHRGKVDAPSGTARRLAAIVLDADPRFESVLEGHPEGRLPPGKLQVVSTRAGAEPGTHRVGWDGEHDLVTLEHRARGREGFALGAVLAAEWLEGRRGIHALDEMLDAVLRGELCVEGGVT
jgi:4-hydroxy-tetrahydrodipicolinate reductase